MNKLTKEQIESKIRKQFFERVGSKTTVCLLTLENGYEVMGTSAIVDPKDYNFDIGCKFAKEKALDKIWELEGYLLQQKNYEN